MKQFFNKLLTLLLFILSFGLFYLATNYVFAIAFVNIALFITAIFVLLQACNIMDKNLGYGKWNTENQKTETKDETEEQPRHGRRE